MIVSRRLPLILLCVLPMVVAGVVTLAIAYHQRGGRLTERAALELGIVDAAMLGTVDASRGVLLAASRVPADPACPAALAALRRDFPGYRFLAILGDGAAGARGAVLCASSLDDVPTGLRERWLRAPPPSGGLQVGTYAAEAGGEGAVLPVTLGETDQLGHVRIVAAGLDLAWFGRQLTGMMATPGPSLTEESVAVVDRDGVVLARFPDPAPGAPSSTQPVGAPVAHSFMARVSGHGPAASTATATADAGADATDPSVVMTAPPSRLPDGLFAFATFDPSGVSPDLRRVVLRGAMLGIAATLAAVLIALVAERRLVGRPAARLIEAARRWTAGDMAARADLRGDRSEFGYLGLTFNRMATDIEARVAEHAEESLHLESRVAERTRELSDSNNRLQVEIAERRRAETVMHQAQKLQAVGQLAGGVAHDFNNLLATILGSLELIERRVPNPDDKLRTLLNRAMDAVQRGAQLTSRLLAFSRRQRLAPRPTDLNRLVTELVTLARSTLGRRVRVDTVLAPDLWSAMVDAGQVEAAILNLALNARDAMPQGGVLTLSTGNEVLEADTPDAEPGDYIRVSVEDTGTGMSRDVLARALEPFFTTKELGQGSGLGLSQVYGLARQSGGTVRIQSEPGAGTTVALLLPRALSNALPRAQAPGPHRAIAQPGANLVLLVDDDADVRHVSVDMLRDLGYDVVEACDGSEALETIRGLPAPPALLVLDYAMPGMNGLRLAAALRGLGITAPLLLATGYAELSDDESGVTPDAVLHKPFSLGELGRTLEQLRAPAPELA